jgi:hypothetical protein
VAWLVAGLALAAGLSAAGWLPGLQFLALSNRASSTFAELAGGFPPGELVGILVPGLTLWSPLYVGVIPLLMAAGAAAFAFGAGPKSPSAPLGVGDEPAAAGRAALRRLRYQVIFWLILGGVALVLSLGGATPVFGVFYRLVPGFNLFRGQERAALLVSFSLAMLSGAGWAVADGARLRGGLRRIFVFGAPFLAICGAMALVAAPDRPGGLHVMVFALGAAALAAAPGVSAPRGWWNRRWVYQGVLLMLVVADLYLANAGTNLTPERPDELRVSPVVASLLQDPNGRVENENRLPANFGVLRAVEALSGASPLRLRTFEALRNGLDDQAGQLRQLLAVAYVLTWKGEIGGAGPPLVTYGAGDDVARLFILDLPSPPVWRVAQAERVDTDSAALARLRATDFDPLSVAVLQDGEGGSPGASGGQLVLQERGPGYAMATTSGDRPAWIVFSEMYYPGWRARVDGDPARVLRADLALMAVPVPAGDHTVELAFSAPWVTAGIAISLASVVVAVLLVVASARRRWPRPRLGRRPRQRDQSVAAWANARKKLAATRTPSK